MAEPNRSSPSASASASASSSSSSSSYREDSGGAAGAAASSSGTSSQVREEEEGQDHEYRQHLQHFHNPELENQHIDLVSYRGNLSGFDDSSTVIGDDTWSCIIVVLTFWFFVSMTLILGVYGAVNIRVGPNCSLLLQPNPIFVQSVKVEEVDDTKPGLKLYGFYKSPSLDVVTTWSETRTATVQADSHKEWIHYLNRGSQVNISYNVNSAGSSVFLIIAQGSEGLSQWLEDPTYPNTTLSWNIVRGSGMIQQDIYRSSSYYIALGNLNSEDVEVELNITVRAFIYNTTEAYYRCTFGNGLCSLSVLFPQGNSVVLTSPGLEQVIQSTSADDWSVRLSYGPRWIIYIVGIGGMTAIMLVAFNFLNKFQFTRGGETNLHYGENASARAPLLSNKDDDISSWGSSYDSVSSDEADLEDFLAAGSVEGTSIREGENSNNTRRLCAICFDAPRDCFFLPCGHCVACFACGSRIAEAAGTCPICRRNMKKVRKIFTV
ncbi:RING/U-box superfamily protein, putative isoform 3 [Theobroma cacao]|uniref:RING/U-box superfamily protein, putative isoform 3 n=1 Tax=Theobroma cacao TaxID=3641 RepID=A0A061EY90_THECC|nr:RING/U-box superfamily protein, putative isoform 3 [Theobroma cacao]